MSSDTNFFTDDSASVHQSNINALSAAGIVEGIGNHKYNALASVRRDQMASFTACTLDLLALS